MIESLCLSGVQIPELKLSLKNGLQVFGRQAGRCRQRSDSVQTSGRAEAERRLQVLQQRYEGGTER